MKDYKRDARFGYSLASGKLCMPLNDFLYCAEELIEATVTASDIDSQSFWDEARAAFEAAAKGSL